MHPARSMLALSQAFAWSALASTAAVWSDAARVLMSAETPAVTPSGPIFDLSMLQGEERAC